MIILFYFILLILSLFGLSWIPDSVATFLVLCLVDFLLLKAIWESYKPFVSWRKKKYEQLIKLKNQATKSFLKRWDKAPLLKRAYIIIAGVVGFALLILFVRLYLEVFLFNWNTTETTAKEDSSIRNLAIAFLGTTSGIGALFGVYLAILRSETNERRTRTEEQRLIAERLNRVTEDLGKKDEDGRPIIAVRLDALYSLEENIRNSNYDYIRIIEMLSDYVRTNSPVASNIAKVNVKEALRKDIQTSLTIIGWNQGLDRVKKERDIEYRLDLSDCDLHGAKLPNTNLSRASFNNSYMEGINLFNATLNSAQFSESNLTLARLHGANLTHANFYKANLNYANFYNAKLNSTNFYRTNLNYASLNRANLTDASIVNSNLTDARLTNTNFQNVNMFANYAYTGNFSKCKNLTQKQLDVIYCGIGVKIPDELTRPKHWPTDELSYDDFIEAYDEWIKTQR